MNDNEKNVIVSLFDVLEALFDDKTGCPWDKSQTPQSMCAYLIAELYELVDAIHDDNRTDITEEIGDMFFLLCMLIRVYTKESSLVLTEAIQTVVSKMKHRHPHIFSTAPIPATQEEYTAMWEAKKREEKLHRIATPLLASIPRSAHPLTKAIQIHKKLTSIAHNTTTAPAVENTSIEDMLVQQLCTIIATAKEHSIDIESALEKYNQKMLTEFQHIQST